MTVFQTKHWQDQIIAGAAKAGELHLIYYMIEMHLPNYIAKKVGQRRMLAQQPVGYLPVVSLAPDPEAAYVTVQLLQQLFSETNRDWLTGKLSTIEFRILLVLKEDIPTPYWYEWWPDWAGPVLPSLTVDRICAGCGGISTVRRDQGWTCSCGAEFDEDGLAVPEKILGKESEDDGQDAQVGEEGRAARMSAMWGTGVVLVPGWHEGRTSRRGYYLPLPSAPGAGEGVGEDTCGTPALQQQQAAYA